jgi:hypothetical protein
MDSVLSRLPPRLRSNAPLPAWYLASWIGGARHRQRFDDVETYCMFVGHGRSGHSLVGALLDAHPEVVLSHELDAARYFRLGFTRNQVYWLILRNERQFARRGATALVDYKYAVPNQWQGRERHLRVIGDKKGGRSSRDLRLHPELVEGVRKAVGVKLRLIHVVRNPYDTISTMFRRKGPGTDLDERIQHFLSLAETVSSLKQRLLPGEMLEIRHEDLIGHPSATLRSIGSFLDLEMDDDYIGDCASILFTSPHRSREGAPWTPELIDRTQGQIERFDSLAGYHFKD